MVHLLMVLPLNAIGAIAGDEFQFFVIYGDMEGGSVSPSVIPDDGFFTPYSNTEDWTGLIGTQATELLQGVLTSSEPESMLPKKNGAA